MRLSTGLRLARISLLPTVWTNVLTGAALAGSDWTDAHVPFLLVAISLFYTGGMFLNDAFDREFDARSRPERPIPSGEVTATTVFGYGFGMLALGALLLVAPALWLVQANAGPALLGGALLAGAIVLYDAWHKNNPLSPLLMGSCRMLVYVTAALAVAGSLAVDVAYGAITLLSYLVGVTYAAKNEHLNRLDHAWPLVFLAAPILYGAILAIEHPLVLLPWAILLGWGVMAVRRLMRRAPGDVPKAVVSLLAGITLVDAVMLAGHGQVPAMIFALGAFALVLYLQRWVSGT